MSSRRLITCLVACFLARLLACLLDCFGPYHTRKHVTIGKHVTFGSCRHIPEYFNFLADSPCCLVLMFSKQLNIFAEYSV